jgi:hypothetical protein
VGSGLLYLSIVVLWGAVLVPMWLKRLSHDELGSIAKFNQSMSLLSSVPQREVPTYQTQTPTQLAAARRRRTVLALSATTVLGTALAIVTNIWILMFAPAILLFGFFAAAWHAISAQEVKSVKSVGRKRLNVSRAELAVQAKEWEAAPTVIPNRVVGEKSIGFNAEQMLDMATTQAEAQNQVETAVEELPMDIVEAAPDRKTAAG